LRVALFGWIVAVPGLRRALPQFVRQRMSEPVHPSRDDTPITTVAAKAAIAP
jgi:hypothetical protein